ncbi:MAG: TIGR00730 family Rossman fold protein [Anaerolineales bacterium]|nr:TIGR00730 family Rossman fold protein [Anaerolineales bacterium]
MKRICVFCGSSIGARPVYAEAARQLGALLARRGLGLVYGGGSVGLMGVLADAALANGGEVIGVIPEFLFKREIEHRGATEIRVVGTMHERKALMADLSDGFIALPGGYGTLDEFCEIISWAQLGLHRKPVGLLNVAGYYDSFLAFLDHTTAEGFVQPNYRALVLDDGDATRLLDRLHTYRPPPVVKWLDREQR